MAKTNATVSESNWKGLRKKPPVIPFAISDIRKRQLMPKQETRTRVIDSWGHMQKTDERPAPIGVGFLVWITYRAPLFSQAISAAHGIPSVVWQRN